MALRAAMAAMSPDNDDNVFRATFGPGSSGAFTRGDPEAPQDHYEFSAKYHIAHMANFPGPGALPAVLAVKTFSFTLLVGQTLPATRQLDYVCSSGQFSEDVTATLPDGVSFAAPPAPKSLSAPGVKFTIGYEQSAPTIIKQHVALTLDRAGPVCRAADYAALRPQLSDMVGALASQILYK